MPTLEWIGKNKVVNHHQEVPFRVLERQYSFDEQGLGEVVGKEGEDMTRHDKWLCMMYPRLMLLQKLLADDGVIFISIDDNELYRFDEFLKIL